MIARGWSRENSYASRWVDRDALRVRCWPSYLSYSGRAPRLARRIGHGVWHDVLRGWGFLDGLAHHDIVADQATTKPLGTILSRSLPQGLSSMIRRGWAGSMAVNFRHLVTR